MLQNNLELIAQYPENSRYKCRGFRGLRLAAPAFVAFDGATIGDQATANSLGSAFCGEVLRYAGSIEEGSMPCRGSQSVVTCHAMEEPTCRKLLVRPAGGTKVVSGGTWPTPCADAEWLAKRADPKWEVIPVMAAGTPVAANLPTQWRGINVSFWTRHPIESLWAVMQHAGLAPEESRIFISYVRNDTTAVADQLFHELTEQGLDVFLDRCSVPVGVLFQERLMQDLCDKAMVVLLNSPNVATSHWVEEEIAIVKSYRLGLLELRFPGGAERPDVDSDFTHKVDPEDLEPAGPDYATGALKLSASKLTRIVNDIKDVHGRALHRRRYQLIDNFAAALQNAGRRAEVFADGTFLLPANGARNETFVGLAARPPELGDFCSLHQRGNVSASRAGWLVSPSPIFLAQRQAHIAWLGALSYIRHVNEGQITQLTASL